MKKRIILFLTLTISLVLVACSGAENTVTLTLEEDGALTELIYKAEGDKVTEQTTKNVIPYELIGINTAEEAESLLADAIEEYQDIEGLTHEIDYQDDMLVETLVTDYENADLEALATIPGFTFEGDLNEGVSLEKSIELMEGFGFEVTE